jgi:hypothetical protein
MAASSTRSGSGSATAGEAGRLLAGGEGFREDKAFVAMDHQTVGKSPTRDID